MSANDFDWSEEAVAKMRELRLDGYSYTKIGIALGGISGDAVLNKMKCLGWDIKAMTAAVGRGGWDEKRIEKMRVLWDAGYSIGAIGAELGITDAAVRHKVDRLEWKTSDRAVPVVAGDRNANRWCNAWSEEEMRILREFMLAPELSSDSVSVWVEASRRLPGRNPDAVRKKYAKMREVNGWRGPNDPALPARVISREVGEDVPAVSCSEQSVVRSTGPKREGDWDEVRKAKLRALWDQGLSTALIAERMQPLSKNSIIGMAHRMKLPARQNPVRKSTQSRTWTQEDLDRLRGMVDDPQMWLAAEGFDSAAGRLLGRSADAIKRKREDKKWKKPDHIPAAQSSTRLVNLRPKFSVEAKEQQAKEETEVLQEAAPGASKSSYWQYLAQQHSGCQWPIGNLESSAFRWCGCRVFSRTQESRSALRADRSLSTFQWNIYCRKHVLVSVDPRGARRLQAALSCEAA